MADDEEKPKDKVFHTEFGRLVLHPNGTMETHEEDKHMRPQRYPSKRKHRQ